jgi:hypothetical protein
MHEGHLGQQVGGKALMLLCRAERQQQWQMKSIDSGLQQHCNIVTRRHSDVQMQLVQHN